MSRIAERRSCRLSPMQHAAVASDFSFGGATGDAADWSRHLSSDVATSILCPGNGVGSADLKSRNRFP
jgi:hypothetical protein